MDRKIQLTIRTATGDRSANIAAPLDSTIADILDSAKTNWNLPADYEYIVRSRNLAGQLVESQTLQQAGISENDVLEIQPLADAG